MANKSLKDVPRFARHWTASVSAFASQIVCAALRCPLAQRYIPHAMKYILLLTAFIAAPASSACVEKTIELDTSLMKISIESTFEDNPNNLFVSIEVPHKYKDTSLVELHFRKEGPFKFEMPLQTSINENGTASSWVHIMKSEVKNVEISAIYNSKECLPQQYVIKSILEYNKSLKDAP